MRYQSAQPHPVSVSTAVDIDKGATEHENTLLIAHVYVP